MPTDRDPVLARRRRIAWWVQLGKRVGYGLFALSIVVFFVGFGAGFTGGLTTTIVASMLVGSVVLAPAIVFGYAVKAAERDDRAAGRLTPPSDDGQDAADTPSA